MKSSFPSIEAAAIFIIGYFIWAVSKQFKKNLVILLVDIIFPEWKTCFKYTSCQGAEHAASVTSWPVQVQIQLDFSWEQTLHFYRGVPVQLPTIIEAEGLQKGIGMTIFVIYQDIAGQAYDKQFLKLKVGFYRVMMNGALKRVCGWSNKLNNIALLCRRKTDTLLGQHTHTHIANSCGGSLWKKVSLQGWHKLCTHIR